MEKVWKELIGLGIKFLVVFLVLGAIFWFAASIFIVLGFPWFGFVGGVIMFLVLIYFVIKVIKWANKYKIL